MWAKRQGRFLGLATADETQGTRQKIGQQCGTIFCDFSRSYSALTHRRDRSLDYCACR